jgi:hypothetical protein
LQRDDYVQQEKIEVPVNETPKEALLRACKVMDSLDLDAAIELYNATNEFEKQNTRIACKYYVAVTRVELAVRKRFGTKDEDKFVHAIGENTEDDARQAKYKVEGDQADVTFPGDTDPSLKMIRVNGIWKVDVSSGLQGMSKDELKKLGDFYQSMEKAAGPIAEKIGKGDYRTTDEVIAAFKPLVDARP